MIALLWDILRDTFFKLNCKQCKFKSIFAVAMLIHLRKSHGVKPTKKDLRFLARYNLLTRLLLSAIALPLFVMCVALKIVCLPLHWLYEIL